MSIEITEMVAGTVFLREQRLDGVHRWGVTSVAGLDEIAGLPADMRAEAAAYLAAHAVAEAPEPVLPPTAADVRAEASRRMQAATGARDAAHLQVLISNASREAIRLLRIKSERPWTAEEAARAAALEAADAAIEAIRAASNAMEAAPPADYRDDGRWP